jgi:hypothetical protein
MYKAIYTSLAWVTDAWHLFGLLAVLGLLGDGYLAYGFGLWGLAGTALAFLCGFSGWWRVLR